MYVLLLASCFRITNGVGGFDCFLSFQVYLDSTIVLGAKRSLNMLCFALIFSGADTRRFFEFCFSSCLFYYFYIWVSSG